MARITIEDCLEKVENLIKTINLETPVFVWAFFLEQLS